MGGGGGWGGLRRSQTVTPVAAVSIAHIGVTTPLRVGMGGGGGGGGGGDMMLTWPALTNGEGEASVVVAVIKDWEVNN